MTVVPVPVPVMMAPAPVVTVVPTPMTVMPAVVVAVAPAHLFRLDPIDLVARGHGGTDVSAAVLARTRCCLSMHETLRYQRRGLRVCRQHHGTNRQT